MSKLKKGYKQTELGVIPEDWEIRNLGDLCSKIQDGNYGGDYPKPYEFIDYGIPFLTSKVIGKDGVIKEHLIDYISVKKNLELLKAHIELNDVLFTNRGASVGAIGFVDSRIAGGNIGPQLTLFRCHNIIIPKFLFHTMKSYLLQKQILSQDSGSAMNFFGIEATKKFQLPLSLNLTEQQAIAEALSDVDALITTLDKVIAKKRNIKQGAMQELLTGRKRLPGIGEGKGYKQTELGLIPEDWGIMTYGEIFNFLTTASYSKADLSENGEIKYIHYGSIHTKWDFILDIGKNELPAVTIEQAKNYPFLSEGDIIMADASEDYEGIGKSIEIINVGKVKVISGLHTFLLRERIKVFANGYKSYLHSNSLIKKQFDRLATGLKVYGVSKYNLKIVKIPLPPLPEQKAIAEVLSHLDEEITALTKERDKYKAIKQGMMQELLTGRIRLI